MSDNSHDGRRWLVPALILAVVAISFAAIFFKQAQPTHPLVSAGLRLVTAALLLSPFVVRSVRAGSMRGRQLRLALLSGLLYGVHFGSWVASLEVTSVTASVTVVTASPLLLAIIGVISGRDRPTRRLWLALALAAAGMAIIGGHDFASDPRALAGDALALLGALAMACYLLVSRSLGKELDVWAWSGVATAVGGTTLLLVAVIADVPIEPASSEALLFLVLAALVPQLVGHSLLTWSLRYAKPTTVAIATLGEPVGSTFLAWAWLGEGVSATTAVGCAVTLGAVALALRGHSALTQTPPPGKTPFS